MGSFYTNVTLRTADRGRVRTDLVARGLAAYVSRPENGALVVFERSAEEQDPAILDGIAAALSKRIGCAALAVMNHDDSVLLYSLFENGRRIDAYNSAPDYFDETEGGERGGDAESIARAFGVPDRAQQLAAILGAGADEDEGFVFEMDRHQQIVEALGLPSCAVATGYNYLEAGEYPPGYGPDDFERVGDA